MPLSQATEREQIHNRTISITAYQRQGGLIDLEGHILDIRPFSHHLAAPNFKNLAGLKNGPGWNRMVRERVGHGKGCTHLVEMLLQKATTAMQAVWSERAPRDKNEELGKSRRLPASMLTTCFTYNDDGPFQRKYFPEDYKALEQNG